MTYYDIAKDWLKQYIEDRPLQTDDEIKDEITYACKKGSKIATIWEGILDETH